MHYYKQCTSTTSTIQAKQCVGQITEAHKNSWPAVKTGLYFQAYLLWTEEIHLHTKKVFAASNLLSGLTLNWAHSWRLHNTATLDNEAAGSMA